MSTAKLQTQLQNVLHGHAWYGLPIYSIIESVSFEAAYEKLPGAPHSIAEIVMHMLARTEEVIKCMRNEPSGGPMRSDWPDVGEPDEQKWPQLVNYFKIANVELIRLISDFDAADWLKPTHDERDTYSGHALSYETMLAGLIQHHVYHAGQISLLNKMING